MGQRTKITSDAQKRPPRPPIVDRDQGLPGDASVAHQVVEVSFDLTDGAVVAVGDPVRVRAGTPLSLIGPHGLVGTFADIAIAAGLRAGFRYSGIVSELDRHGRSGVARLNVS